MTDGIVGVAGRTGGVAGAADRLAGVTCVVVDAAVLKKRKSDHFDVIDVGFVLSRGI